MTLYVTVLDRPKNSEVVVSQLADIYPYLSKSIESVSLIGSEEKIQWVRNNTGLHLSFPANASGNYAWCYKIRLK